MDIQQLRYFLAVAEELHFGRAAERLHVTASPVSRRVRELEHVLGRDLFVREHHHVELTPFGKKFREKAAEVVRAFDGLRDLAAAHADTRRCRIGAAALTSPTVLDTVLDLYRELAPSVALPVTLASSAELLDQLASRQVDIAVTHLPTDRADLRSLVIARASLGVAMPADDELAGRASLSLRDLSRRRLLVTSSKVHPSVMGRLRSTLVDAGITDLVTLPHSDIVQTAAHVLRTGVLTLTMLSSQAPAARVFDTPAFRIVPLDEPAMEMTAGVVWCAGTESAVPGLAEVIGALRERYGCTRLSL
ncbi:LysR family transcriptional regulator [Streptomyces sp. NPDC057074]|uniref:LysR family transcriptional regulator n=1 Tax=Streptomyces sp. NPDC057074 TaxID=3346015 RepID=UPI003645175F